MFDLHTHSFWSDGVLAPAELARRCRVRGYRGLVISDHVDLSNLEQTVEALVRFCKAVAGHYRPMQVLPGCELTHVPPDLIGPLVQKARDAGAALVLMHGETLVEPVAPGTNRAAIEASVDVLAHPGLLTDEDAVLAVEKGVLLEITARKGHCLTNGHVASVARRTGAKLSFGSDGHAPGDYPNRNMMENILKGAGLQGTDMEQVMANNRRFFASAS